MNSILFYIRTAGITLLIAFYGVCFADTVDWVKWQPMGQGEVDGLIKTTGLGTVAVQYTGEILFAQSGAPGENMYWLPSAPYQSAEVSNPPPNSGLIALTGGEQKTQTISFSRPVSDPVIAIVSLGDPSTTVRYHFSSDFDVLGTGAGYFGNGPFLKESSGVLRGTEGHGCIQFKGIYTSISWTVEGYEKWHAFTVGVPETLNLTPKVLGSFINHGEAQRSMIQGIGVTFDRDVSSSLASADLKVRNIATGAMVDVSGASLLFDPQSFSATWVLDKNPNHLLPDGNFIAWVELGQLAFDGDRIRAEAEHLPLDDFTFGFHQLAGDSDGDRDVDFKDSWNIRNAWGSQSGQSPYRTFFDFNLDGTVGASDRLRIQPNYFTTLPEAVGLHLFLRNDTGDSAINQATNIYDLALGIVGGTQISRLEFRIDGGSIQNESNLLGETSPLILSSQLIDQYLGHALTVGHHIAEVRTYDAAGQPLAAETLGFNFLGAVDLPPVFTSVPPQGVVLPSAGNASQNDLIFEVPGVTGQPVSATFTWTIRSALYNNEFGIYQVSNSDGRVGDMHLKISGDDDTGPYSLRRINGEIADRQNAAAEELLLEHEIGKEIAKLTAEKERLSDSVLLANSLTEISEYLERTYALVAGEMPQAHAEIGIEQPRLLSEYSVQ
jgi:hypothetical protein